jgi:hypothetical protein
MNRWEQAMNRKLALSVCIAIAANCLTTHSAFAVILGFKPGDAFFHAKLTKVIAVDQAKEKPETIELECASVPWKGGFGGYTGFQKLTIKNVPESMRRQLKQAYWRIRELIPRELRVLNDGSLDKYGETNALGVFIYNRDVDWKTQQFAIKYNEHWSRPPDPAQEKFAHRLFSQPNLAQVYESYIDSPEAVVEDWKNSERFAALKATIPDQTAWDYAGPPIEAPIVVDAKDIQIIITHLDDSLPLLFERNDPMPFVSLTVDGEKLVELEKHNTIELDWDPEKEPYRSIDEVLLHRESPDALEVEPLPTEE